MLRVGLTGGIGAGKSTVAGLLAARGATIVDSDALAREVLAPGTSGLAEAVEAFGPGILDPGGALDRAHLAAVVFADPQARARLNAIVHPRVRERTEEVFAAAAPGTVVVNDVPLLVEAGLGAGYHLVLVVDAPLDVRLERLRRRGMDEAQARARIAAQADDDARRAAADVWLDNGGAAQALDDVVGTLWDERLLPFARGMAERRPGRRPGPVLLDRGAQWAAEAARLAARISHTVGGARVDHIGSTAVPGLPAKDVVDLQLSVASLTEADAVADSLAAAGFVRWPGAEEDRPHPVVEGWLPVRGDAVLGGGWGKRLHVNVDPGRAVNLHVRVSGAPNWTAALLMRDWLRASAPGRAGYLVAKRALAELATTAAYAEAKEPWFTEGFQAAVAWARDAGWSPGPGLT